MKRVRYQWWHGVLFYAGVQAVSLLLRKAAQSANGRSPKPEKDGYVTDRVPVFAPPRAAFPIAWTINSISAIAGGLYVLNLPSRTAGRTRFLQLQGAAWTLYAVFQAAYFGFRSPIDAEIVTVCYTAVTVASVDAALRTMGDPKPAASLASTVAWLALANPVGLASATWNYDPFWKVGPLLEPKPEWLKSAQRPGSADPSDPQGMPERAGAK
jgi:tryptophan-rich sensory protein